LRATLALVASVRAEVSAPIVIFSYANPLLRMGLDIFAREAAAVGVDGVLTLDLPIEEADQFRTVLATAGLDIIFLLSPTTTDARIQRAAELGTGFLYAISRLGVTGARATVSADAEGLIRRIRARTTLPVALGFGLSSPEHIGQVGGYADAARVAAAGRARLRPLPAGARARGRPLRRCRGGRQRARRADRRTWPDGGAHPGGGTLRPSAEERVCHREDMTKTMSTLDEIRLDIDRVDEVLVRLLNERARCVCEIGRLKKESGLEIYQPDREKDVLNHVRAVASEGPLGPDAIARLFERIIDEARRLERRVVHGDGDVTA
jgi:chorismate mutase